MCFNGFGWMCLYIMVKNSYHQHWKCFCSLHTDLCISLVSTETTSLDRGDLFKSFTCLRNLQYLLPLPLHPHLSLFFFPSCSQIYPNMHHRCRQHQSITASQHLTEIHNERTHTITAEVRDDLGLPWNSANSTSAWEGNVGYSLERDPWQREADMRCMPAQRRKRLSALQGHYLPVSLVLHPSSA